MKNKSIKFLILTLIIILSLLLPKETFAASTVQLGDINSDGKVDTSDLLLVLRHMYTEETGKHKEWKLTGDKFIAADATKSNKVDMTDVLSILRHMAATGNAKIKQKNPKWVLGTIKKQSTSTTVNTTTKTNTTNTTKQTVNTTIGATSIKLNQTTIRIKVGDMQKLTATITPTNVTNKTITWTSSDETRATVRNGLVVALKEGSTIVTAKTSNGKEAICLVIIEKKATSTSTTTTTKTTTKTTTNTNTSYIMKVPYYHMMFGYYHQDTKKWTNGPGPSGSIAQVTSNRSDYWWHYKKNGYHIGEYGCGIYSSAMAVSYVSGKTVSPVNLINMSSYTGPGSTKTVAVDAANKYGLKSKLTSDFNEVVTALKSGKPVVMFVARKNGNNCPFTKGQHYITLVGVTKDGKIAVADPGGSGMSTSYCVNGGKAYTQAQMKSYAGGSAGYQAYTIIYK